MARFPPSTVHMAGGGNEVHMRVSLPTRRPPTMLEQLLGRRRARVVRRRLGVVAIGLGYTLLRPRSKVVPVALATTVVALAAWLVLG